MGLHVISGDDRYDKRSHILDQLFDQLKQDPDCQIYYIVPEHSKFEMEAAILDYQCQKFNKNSASLMALQVASFSRLAWFLMRDQKTKQSVSDLGLAMIIQTILRQSKDQIRLFRRQIKHPAFAEQLLVLFKELLEGNVTASDLSEDQLESLTEDTDPKTAYLEDLKLAELRYIYQAFLDELNRLDFQNFQLLNDLNDYLKNSNLSNTVIVIDQYDFFSSQEMQVVLNLAKCCKTVWLALSVDEEILKNKQPSRLYSLACYTYNRLRTLSYSLGIDFTTESPEGISYLTNSDQCVLLDSFKQLILDHHSYSSPMNELPDLRKVKESSFCHFSQAASLEEELRYVANQIHDLVVHQGYRYRDIQVFARHMDRYQAIIDPIFQANKIPYFFDHALPMKNHRLYELIIMLAALDRYQWQLEDIQQFIKSPLIRLMDLEPYFSDFTEEELEREYRHLLAQVDNYLYTHQLSGYQVYQLDYPWYFANIEQAYIDHQGKSRPFAQASLIEAFREGLVTRVFNNMKHLSQQTSGEALATGFYHLLQQLTVTDQLRESSVVAVKRGDQGVFRQNEQVWQLLMDAIQEFHMIYGQNSMTLEEFFLNLQAALEGASFHIIPPTLDQVRFSNFISPQVQTPKIAFLVGMDQDALPLIPQDSSLLTREERAKIADRLLPYQQLIQPVNFYQGFELLQAYRLFLKANQRLYFSMAQTVQNKVLDWSPYLKTIIQRGDFDVKIISVMNWQTKEKDINLDTIGQYPMTLAPILRSLRVSYETASPIESLSQSIVYLLQSHPFEKERLESFIQGLFRFYHLPDRIDSDLALALYGKNMSLSVSQVEQYYQDPFSHFLLYGLRLKERRIAQIDPMSAGDFLHFSLDQLAKSLQDQAISLADLNSKDLDQRLHDIIATSLSQKDFRSFNQDTISQAVFKQLQEQLFAFVHLIHQQNEQLPARILISEGQFGRSKNDLLPSFSYSLESGGELFIRGKIDRIDLIDQVNQAYLQVIDYKSSNKQFNLVDSFYGLDLQILTYLAVALKKYPQARPLGAFYQPILQGYRRADKSIAQLDSEGLKTDFLKERRLNGFVTLSSDVLLDLEKGASLSKQSLIYPVRYKKDGTYYSGSPYFDASQVKTLLAYTHWMFKKAADQIQAGHIEFAPFIDAPYTPSLRRPYRVITGFDASQSYSAYRQKEIDKKTVLEAMDDQLTHLKLQRKEKSDGITD
ncbi:PD-(D/E)XK nuclease family protein [Facklamia hominis]